jgi:hypothetical protein
MYKDGAEELGFKDTSGYKVVIMYIIFISFNKG